VRIAISGVHRSGKTTLGEKVNEMISFTFFPMNISYSPAWRMFGVKPTDQMSFIKRIELQDALLDYMISKYKVFNQIDNWVTDRSPLDLIAYLLVNVDETANDADRIVKFIEKCERTMNKYLDCNFIVRMSEDVDMISLNSDTDKQGEVYSSRVYRLSIDQMMVGLMMDMSKKVTTSIIEIPQDYDETFQRFGFILEKVNQLERARELSRCPK
jgi:hypothetical protein